MKEWYQKNRRALLVIIWGLGLFALGFIIAKFVF